MVAVIDRNAETRKFVIHQVNTLQISERTTPCQYFVRHGECCSNIRWPIPNYKDQNDILTAEGQKQAEIAAKTVTRLRHNTIPPIAVFCSTLTRALQTEAIMRKTLDLPGKAVVDARLIEYGGDEEGYARFFARVASFLEEVKTIEHDILVVTHGHVLQAVLTLHHSLQTCGCRMLLPSPAETRNGGVCVFGRGKLRYWNA